MKGGIDGIILAAGQGYKKTKRPIASNQQLSGTGCRLVLSDSGGVRLGLLHRVRLFCSEMGWKFPVFLTGHERARGAA